MSLDSQHALFKALVLTFVKGVLETFKTQVGSITTPGQMQPYHPDKFDGKIDLAASVGLLCPRFSGSLTVGYPTSTFIAAANKVLGENYTAITNENRDFGAEMLNIILGVTKTNFSKDHDIVIQPAIPLVVQGSGIKFSVQADQAPFLIPFKCDLGEFYATVAVSNLS